MAYRNPQEHSAPHSPSTPCVTGPSELTNMEEARAHAIARCSALRDAALHEIEQIRKTHSVLTAYQRFYGDPSKPDMFANERRSLDRSIASLLKIVERSEHHIALYQGFPSRSAVIHSQPDAAPKRDRPAAPPKTKRPARPAASMHAPIAPAPAAPAGPDLPPFAPSPDIQEKRVTPRPGLPPHTYRPAVSIYSVASVMDCVSPPSTTNTWRQGRSVRHLNRNCIRRRGERQERQRNRQDRQ